MNEVLSEDAVNAFALVHHAAVMGRIVKPCRFWADCPVAECNWTGQEWPSAVIAEAEGKLHRLANCEHPGAMSINPLDPEGATLLCTECGVPVIVKKDVRGRYLIMAAPDA